MRRFPLILAGFALFCGLLHPGEAEEFAAKGRTVVLISIDGFPAWIWRDPTLAAPTLRRLASEGASADAMTVVNPSVTWINHTTLVTGVHPRKHGVLFNGLLVRQTPLPPIVEPWRDKAELVHVPTVYDVVHQAGMTTAQVDWVAIQNSGTINWEMRELPKGNGTDIEREMVEQGMLTAEELAGFGKSKNIAWRDMMWSRAATHIIKTRKPNLLLFHLLTTDAINHANGPGSQASFAAFAYADRLVSDVIAALAEAGLKDKSTVIVATDHGFKKVAKIVYPNVVLRKAGLVQVDKELVSSCDAYVMAQGGVAFVYVTDPLRRQALLPELRDLFEKTEGVAKVMDGNEGPTMGMPTPAENQGMGDLVLYPKAGYAFQSPSNGEEAVVESTKYLGTHGYPSDDPDLDGTFIAWGYGIKPGAKVQRMRSIDVAPTIAELLGVKIPGAEGQVLREILK